MKYTFLMGADSDSGYRYITSNNVPDYYMNPYCPIGLGYGYCVPQVAFGIFNVNVDFIFGQEIHCYFPDLICGVEGNGKMGSL